MKYHFIGIGGIGMGKLASLLLSKGHPVSGSDVTENAMTQALRGQGADIMIGHHARNIGDAECVVYSSAIHPQNSERVEAEKRGCRLIRRAELLADLMCGQFGVTIAGAHGKTTTTSMIAHMLIHAGKAPTVALGGVFTQGSYKETLGDDGYFVAELDESDGSFLFFSPHISVITNIDFEHVDYYKDWNHILSAYARFVSQTSDNGLVIACGDDPRLRQTVQHSGKAALYYGIQDGNDLRAEHIRCEDGRTVFACVRGWQSLGEVSLGVPGVHNVLNGMACIGAGLRMGLPFAVIQQAMASYQGVRRRLERKGVWEDIRLIDDYAHHPTEIKAALAAVKGMSPKRIIALFQPHRYTRAKFLWNEFLEAFDHADVLMVTDIYAASEEPLEGVDSYRLCQEISERSGRPAVYVAKEDLARSAVEIVQPGDCIVTLGAGDITKICDEVAGLLKERLAVNHG